MIGGSLPIRGRDFFLCSAPPTPYLPRSQSHIDSMRCPAHEERQPCAYFVPLRRCGRRRTWSPASGTQQHNGHRALKKKPEPAIGFRFLLYFCTSLPNCVASYPCQHSVVRL